MYDVRKNILNHNITKVKVDQNVAIQNFIREDKTLDEPHSIINYLLVINISKVSKMGLKCIEVYNL